MCFLLLLIYLALFFFSMTHISRNLKKIRSVKALSQSAFGEILGVERHNIGAYEEGRATPKTELLIKIANIFSIDLEKILTKDLTVNDISGFRLKEELTLQSNNDINMVMVEKSTLDSLIKNIVTIEADLNSLKKELRKLK